MNKYILSIGLVFTMSFTPTFAQEEVERSVEEVVVTALRQEIKSARYCDYYYCYHSRRS